MKKRILALTLIGVCAAVLMSGCGKTSQSDKSSDHKKQTSVSKEETDEEDVDEEDIEEDTDEDADSEDIEEDADEVEDDEDGAIDGEVLNHGDIAGRYVSDKGGEASISIYTDMSEDAVEVGNIEIMNSAGEVKFKGNLDAVADNEYEVEGKDITVSVSKGAGAYTLDIFVDGERYDVYEMVEHYES